jgi:hypothetical protein
MSRRDRTSAMGQAEEAQCEQMSSDLPLSGDTSKASSRRSGAAPIRREASRENERQRRERAIAKAQAAFDTAQREHEARASAIEEARAAVENRARAEEARWQKQKRKLDLSVRRARS